MKRNKSEKDIGIWLRFEDLINFDPNKLQKIWVRGEMENEEGKINTVGWLFEKSILWSVLIPIRYINKAIIKLAEWDIEISTYWESDTKFNFGEERNIESIPIKQFIFEREHPITHDTIIELRQDFVRYHSLEFRNDCEYFHPLENLVVSNIKFLPHDPKKIGKVWIHSDFLKDYLAAKKCGLLVKLVIDRFYNTSNIQELEINEELRHIIKPGFIREIDIYSSYKNKEDIYEIHSTIWKTDVIRPYNKPKKERSVWYHPSSLHPIPTSSEFFINKEGMKLRLLDEGVPVYLYFHRNVLERYINTQGYNVFFHMRKWGLASNPRGQSIDVGINSEGLVNAYSPDIAKLPASEQAYWSSCSIIPSGEICEELFRTRMMNDPPHSPGVFELMHDAKSRIDKLFISCFGEKLFKEKEPEKKALNSLTIGPLRDQIADLVYLAKVLYQWIIESMELKNLKKAINDALKDEVDAGQIRHLEELLMRKANLTSDDAKDIIKPLRGLNTLRKIDAHLSSENMVQTALMQLKVNVPLTNMIKIWDLIIDRITYILNKISDLLEYSIS